MTSTDRRGAEVFATDLGVALSRRGHSVRTVALAPGNAGAGIDVPALGSAALGLPTLRRVRRAATTADVVIAHGSRTLPACAIALVGTTPFVYRNIGDPMHWSSRGIRHVRTRAFLRRAQRVVALTNDSAVVLQRNYGVATSRLAVIPTGAPAARNRRASAPARATARQALSIPSDARVASVIGALSPEKNVSLALSATAYLPDLHLVVAGDGPERRELEVMASGRAHVHFVGALADPSPAFDAADVVVLSSRTEGLPGVLIEAGLRGLPAVATDVGYVRSIVIDGETGFLVSADDDKALAAAITRAIDAAPRLGDRAHEHCRNAFEIDAIATRWCELLERMARR